MDDLGVDEVGVDEVGVDEAGVEELGVDDLGVDDASIVILDLTAPVRSVLCVWFRAARWAIAAGAPDAGRDPVALCSAPTDDSLRREGPSYGF